VPNVAMLLDTPGSELSHIVKVVVYLTDIRYGEVVYRAMGKWLKGVFPVPTGLVGRRGRGRNEWRSWTSPP
jgi:enamine deaminase RidA (YjgF/YER057c/UK114 family)